MNKKTIPSNDNALIVIALLGLSYFAYINHIKPKVLAMTSQFFTLGVLSVLSFIALSITIFLISKKRVHQIFGTQKPVTKSNAKIRRLSTQSLRFRHTLIVGTPGTGKTFGVLYPQIYEDIKENKFILIIDPKGDHSFRDAIYSMASSFNRAEDFHYISLNHPELTAPYSFLNFGTPTELRDKLIAATTWDNSYYKKLAETKLLSILNTNPKTILEIVKAIPDSEAYSGLRADIFNLYQSPLKDSFEHPNASTLLDFYSNKSILFISLDVLSFPITSRSLGRILLNDLKTLINHIQAKIQNDSRTPTTIVIDEFVSFASLEFIDLLNKARSAKVQVIMATQSVSDFEVHDKNLLPQIVDSTSNKIILRLSDPKSIEYCSKLVGTTTEEKMTKQVTTNNLFNHATGAGSLREVEKFIIAPKDIRRLGSLEGYLYTQDPFYVSKVNFNRFLKHKLSITPFHNYSKTHIDPQALTLTPLNPITKPIEGELPPCLL